MLVLIQNEFVCTKLKDSTVGFAQFALAQEYLVTSLVSQYFGSEGMSLIGTSSLNIPQFVYLMNIR